jgi:hypothetical protein
MSPIPTASVECCRLIADLEATVGREGATQVDRFGITKMHPALVEARMQQTLLARLLSELRLPPVAERPRERESMASGVRRQGRRFKTVPGGLG